MYADSCYYLVNNTATWTEAYETCLYSGAHLVTLSSAGENQFVTELVKAMFASKKISL